MKEKQKQKRKRERTWAEAARMVLENYSDAPMTPKQILHVIEAEGLKEKSGMSPLACLNAMLHSNSRPNNGIFYKLPGRISLFTLKKDASQWSKSTTVAEREEFEDGADSESCDSNEVSTASGENDVSLDETSSSTSYSAEVQSKQASPSKPHGHRAAQQTGKQKKKGGMLMPRVVLTPLKVNGELVETASGCKHGDGDTSSSSSCSSVATSAAALRSRTDLAKNPPPYLKNLRKAGAGQMKRNREEVDFETPGSILVNTNLRALINTRTLAALPSHFQQQLLLLLPEIDRQVGADGPMRLSNGALNNEFFTHAAQSWQERLADGEFTHEMQVRIRQEMEKEKRVEMWKERFFEDYYGQSLGLTKEESKRQTSSEDSAEKRTSLPAQAAPPSRPQRSPGRRRKDGRFRKRSRAELGYRPKRPLYRERKGSQAKAESKAEAGDSDPREKVEVDGGDVGCDTKPMCSTQLSDSVAESKPDDPKGPPSQDSSRLRDPAATTLATAASTAAEDHTPSMPCGASESASDLSEAACSSDPKDQKRKFTEPGTSSSFAEKKPRLEDRQSFRNTIESVHTEKPQPTKEEPKVPPIRIQLSRIKPRWVVKGQPAYQICPRIIPSTESSSRARTGARTLADIKARALQARAQREAAAATASAAISGGGWPGGGEGGGGGGGGGEDSGGGGGGEERQDVGHGKPKRAAQAKSDSHRTQLLQGSRTGEGRTCAVEDVKSPKKEGEIMECPTGGISSEKDACGALEQDLGSTAELQSHDVNGVSQSTDELTKTQKCRANGASTASECTMPDWQAFSKLSSVSGVESLAGQGEREACIAGKVEEREGRVLGSMSTTQYLDSNVSQIHPAVQELLVTPGNNANKLAAERLILGGCPTAKSIPVEMEENVSSGENGMITGLKHLKDFIEYDATPEVVGISAPDQSTEESKDEDATVEIKTEELQSESATSPQQRKVDRAVEVKMEVPDHVQSNEILAEPYYTQTPSPKSRSPKAESETSGMSPFGYNPKNLQVSATTVEMESVSGQDEGGGHGPGFDLNFEEPGFQSDSTVTASDFENDIADDESIGPETSNKENQGSWKENVLEGFSMGDSNPKWRQNISDRSNSGACRRSDDVVGSQQVPPFSRDQKGKTPRLDELQNLSESLLQESPMEFQPNAEGQKRVGNFSRPGSVEANNPLVMQLLKGSLPLEKVLPQPHSATKLEITRLPLPSEPQPAKTDTSSVSLLVDQATKGPHVDGNSNLYRNKLNGMQLSKVKSSRESGQKRRPEPMKFAIANDNVWRQPCAGQDLVSEEQVPTSLLLPQQPEDPGVQEKRLFSSCSFAESKKEVPSAPKNPLILSALLNIRTPEKLNPPIASGFLTPRSATLDQNPTCGSVVNKYCDGVQAQGQAASGYSHNATVLQHGNMRAPEASQIQPKAAVMDHLPAACGQISGETVPTARVEWHPELSDKFGGVENENVPNCGSQARKEVGKSSLESKDQRRSCPLKMDIAFSRLPVEIGKGLHYPMDVSSISSKLNIHQQFYGKISKLQFQAPGFGQSTKPPVPGFPKNFADRMKSLGHKAGFGSHNSSLPVHVLAESGLVEEMALKCSCRLKAMIMCKGCGAFCHDDCIGPSKLCVLCLVVR
ncbi:putative Polycomb group protein ASXL1 [Latimeria chalumnae]|uniref:putative Polycomb group protein ASXL1 n=1 Tax=Latimeria chalumnae TaxID=7897 RepID=UPI0006D92943|nr:PREDICTED: putative Polycomb group protein ASXL1 [Latimeria chalumnae]|eukprot:XP_014353784.1 PREDICTED: putative Polycomb group protein ASXL1 [Latimeria chalumnae]